jgi:hypothetical protein
MAQKQSDLNKSRLLSRFTIEEAAVIRVIKNLHEGGSSPSFFTVIAVTYRFPFGLALAPSRKT